MNTDAHDPRITQILQLVSQLVGENPQAKAEEGDTLDAITRELDALAKELERATDFRTYYNNILQSTVASLVVSDLNGNITLVNPSACRLLGYQEQAVLGQPISGLFVEPFNPDDAELVDARERTVITKESRLLPVSSLKSGLYNRQGQREGHIFVLQDISEQKRVEKALRASEARYRAMIESQVDLISRYLPDATLTFVNDAYCQFYGKTREQLIGNKLLPMVVPEFREQVRQETLNMVKNPQPISGDYLNYGGDGKEYWIHWVIQGIVDEKGHVGELQAAGRDITRLKQVEAALRVSEQRLREAQEVAHIGNWDWNPITRELYWSDENYRIFGFPPQAFPLNFQIFLQSLHPGDRENIQQNANRALAGQPYEVNNFRVVWPNGLIRWVEQRIHVVYDEHGVPTRIYGTTQDVTDQKQAKDAIQQLNMELEKRVRERTAELEVVNEEIKNFAYIVSHDLRAPLINLKGFAAELRFAVNDLEAVSRDVLPLIDQAGRETMLGVLHESIPEALQYIESSTSHMDSLIKAILRLSRFGRQELDFVEVDVRSVVEKILKTLAFQINDQNVQVTLGSLPTVIADPVSLEQILGNILTNAVIYLAPGRRGEIEISGEPTADETIFRVRDNGRGIAPEDMGNVFAAFRRAGKQDVPGEGMGLAYVQTLVRRHGGRIWCESELDVGTTFTFTISRHRIAESDQPSSTQTQ